MLGEECHKVVGFVIVLLFIPTTGVQSIFHVANDMWGNIKC